MILSRIIKQGLIHKVIFVQRPEEGERSTNAGTWGEIIHPEEPIRSEVLRWEHDQSVCGMERKERGWSRVNQAGRRRGNVQGVNRACPIGLY